MMQLQRRHSAGAVYLNHSFGIDGDQAIPAGKHLKRRIIHKAEAVVAVRNKGKHLPKLLALEAVRAAAKQRQAKEGRREIEGKTIIRHLEAFQW